LPRSARAVHATGLGEQMTSVDGLTGLLIVQSSQRRYVPTLETLARTDDVSAAAWNPPDGADDEEEILPQPDPPWRDEETGRIYCIDFDQAHYQWELLQLSVSALSASELMDDGCEPDESTCTPRSTWQHEWSECEDDPFSEEVEVAEGCAKFCPDAAKHITPDEAAEIDRPSPPSALPP